MVFPWREAKPLSIISQFAINFVENCKNQNSVVQDSVAVNSTDQWIQVYSIFSEFKFLLVNYLFYIGCSPFACNCCLF